jgi:hypothetical protein
MQGRATQARPGEPVRYEPEDPDVALMMRSGEMPYRTVQRFRHVYYVERGFAPVYAPICEGPCNTQLAPGVYHLALSKDGGRAIPVGEVVLNGPSAIRATYEDRSGTRVLGDVIGLGGVIGGIVMIVVSVDSQTCDANGDYCQTNVNGPLLAGGIGVLVGGAIIGGILASQRDTAAISVTPLTAPSVGSTKETPMAAIGAGPPPQGAALTVRF